MSSKKTVGSWILEQVRAHGISLDLLALATGINRVSLYGYVRGYHSPSIPQFEKLCRGLGLTVEQGMLQSGYVPRPFGRPRKYV